MKKLILSIGMSGVFGSLITAYFMLKFASKSETIRAGINDELTLRIAKALYGEVPKRHPASGWNRYNA